jgi:uncharacterized protein YbcC (UPF0753/DUF2309 family)
MNTQHGFNESEVLQHLRHYLPAQAPLKDFIHHNTLHAFQQQPFFDGIRHASAIFGYRVQLALEEYRQFFRNQKISETVLDNVLQHRKGAEWLTWKERLLRSSYDKNPVPRIGALRAHWKKQYLLDMDSLVHPILFRTLCSYLDQGIAMWPFPVSHKGFLASIRELEKNTYTSLFRSERVRRILTRPHDQLADLLRQLVGDETLYEQYLFDQQFAHQGWSGMVSMIETQPESLLNHKKISLHDLIFFECLLEMDVLETYHEGWRPLQTTLPGPVVPLFDLVPTTERDEVLALWQQILEANYYDQVLAGLALQRPENRTAAEKSFQALFCIDDRECSLRRYLEKQDPRCETFGTPGFFGVEFYYKPEGGKFYTKLCPAPVTPKYLIKEYGSKVKRERDLHLARQSHGLFRGWLISQTLGFWSALRLFVNIFKPSMSPATATSFRHMDKYAQLTFENRNPNVRENNLQVGFSIIEMADRVEALLRSIGLVRNFARLVYVVGHGSSSVNNPHYAAYDCGACSGRAGSVNARVICSMANHPEVRAELGQRGLVIPRETRFVGGLHDTTRDDIQFFDEDTLPLDVRPLHNEVEHLFERALDLNAKERSRRFESIDSHETPAQIHERVRVRSVSLFEPRPELNHATNALCIVGRRGLTRGLFLDRRSFLNSFSYQDDPEGKYLFNILKAAAPVCGGINLEYYFSRVDNQKLGAGTKLPHNVMGLFGVANGIDGDLRPGLPSQMIEVHDPVRLLIVVEHFPEVVLQTIQRHEETYEWFRNEWVNLAVIQPETHQVFVFRQQQFERYQPVSRLEVVSDITPLIESNQENFPVYLIEEPA